MSNEWVSKQNGVEALCGNCNTLGEIGRFPWIPLDLADSAAQILEEGNRRRVHGAQSLESDRLKMVRMGKVCVFGWFMMMMIIIIYAKNDRSGHYSGQSSRMKESWSNTLLNRYWHTLNKKAVSSPRRQIAEWSFFARRLKKSQADSLIGPSVSTAIGSK